MVTLLTLLAYAMTVFILGFMAWEHLRGKTDALSIRNFGLLGYVMFMIVSAPMAFTQFPGNPYNLSNPQSTGAKYMAWAVVFLGVFLITYRMGFGVPRLVKLLPKPKSRPGDATVFAMAVVMSGIAFPMLFSVMVPYIGTLSGWVGTSLCAVSAGMVGWVWSKRLFNPVIAIPAIIIVAFDFVLAQWGEFGRRSMVTVGAAFIWGMYYGNFRYLAPTQQALRVALFTIPPVLVIGLYSSVRDSTEAKAGKTFSKAFAQGNALDGLSEATAQNAANIGMWVMEQQSLDRIEHRHLFSIQYFFLHPVPRALFPRVGLEKPWPLSTMTADLANRRGVKSGRLGITNPAGVIGNASVEGGFYALIVYAFVGALLLRFLDDLVQSDVLNPLLVLPPASALGQTLGLARGEVPVFAFMMVFSTVATIIVMVFVGKVIDRVAPQLANTDLDGASDDWGDEFEDYGDWDAGHHERADRSHA